LPRGGVEVRDVAKQGFGRRVKQALRVSRGERVLMVRMGGWRVGGRSKWCESKKSNQGFASKKKSRNIWWVRARFQQRIRETVGTEGFMVGRWHWRERVVRGATELTRGGRTRGGSWVLGGDFKRGRGGGSALKLGHKVRSNVVNKGGLKPCGRSRSQNLFGLRGGADRRKKGEMGL